MSKLICRSFPIFLLLLFSAFNAFAQQANNGKAVPSLSSDGVLIRRGITHSGAAWKRYSPEGFGLSFELPGEPFELPYPIPPRLQSEVLESKALDYVEDGLTAHIAHLVLSEPLDLKRIAEEMKSAMIHSDRFPALNMSLISKGDRIVIRGNFVRNGLEVDLSGLIVGSGKHAWFMNVQTLRAKPELNVVSTRILNSATIVR